MLFSEIMDMKDFPLSQYLARIGLSKVPDCSEEGLREVHAGQAFSIPFENLDIHLQRAISLEPEDLTSKIIDRRRGGYCFEHNGVLYLALKSMGFKVRRQLARVVYNRTEPGARTHQVLIVTISGQDWLADTGFGGPGLRVPLPMIPDEIQEQYGERFCLRRDSRYGMMLQKESNDTLVNLYVFDENELTLDMDIEMANHFTSSWRSSIFLMHRMCSLQKSWGRVTLSDMELTIHRDGQSLSRTLRPGPQYMDAIEEYFGISLNAVYTDFVSLNRIRNSEA
jgi:N-hydroxyarylamine O-acetyltransferase